MASATISSEKAMTQTMKMCELIMNARLRSMMISPRPCGVGKRMCRRASPRSSPTKTGAPARLISSARSTPP